jgi:hypothetical protein
MEGEAMHRMHDDGNMRPSGSNSPDEASFGGVGMNDIVGLTLQVTPQPDQSYHITPGPYGTPDTIEIHNPDSSRAQVLLKHPIRC